MEKAMKKSLTVAALAATLMMGAQAAETIKVGVALGFTGPAESLAPAMAAGAELAMKEVSDSGALLGGTKVVPVRGDSTCIDAAAATATAERLVSSEKVKAIIGGLCSGATTAMLKNVALPKGVLLFSPSATSPALTTIPDNEFFFRASPSDARQGQIVADMLMEKGVKKAALTYTNNDYGKGLADSIKTNFEAKGGKVTIYASHEDGKGDYTAEVGALASAGGDILIVVGYLDQGGRGIIRSSLDTGAFSTFFLPDAMIGDSLTAAIGAGLNGSYGVVPGTDSPGAAKYDELTKKAGFKNGPYSPESYDAAALTLLAMQAAKSTDSNKVKMKVRDVANAPGVKIYPGELAKGLKLLAEGKDIDYVGATAVELIGPGESAGNYRTVQVKGGKFETTGYR
jgi:branched-chain amino acid transport system substrate-binding protein